MIRVIKKCYGIALIFHSEMSIQHDVTDEDHYYEAAIAAHSTIAMSIAMQRVALIESVLPSDLKPGWWRRQADRFSLTS